MRAIVQVAVALLLFAALSAAPLRAQTITNGSFESPSIPSSTVYQRSADAWSFTSTTGVSGITANGSAFFAGGTPWTPYGRQVALIQGDGRATQSVSLGSGAQCTLAFNAVQRQENQDATGITVKVETDGTAVWSGIPVRASWRAFSTSFHLAAGVHSIAFHGLNPAANDNTVFIDNASMNCTPDAPPPGGPFSNGGFEAPFVGTGPSAYRYSPAGATWTFANGAGISGNGSGFTAGNPPAPEGVQVAFLQTYGTMTQTPSINAGTYTISFKAAQRGNYQSGTQIVRVSVDGVTVGTFQPPGTSYAFFETQPFAIASTTNHTIAFAGAGGGGVDFTAFVDDVRINTSRVCFVRSSPDMAYCSSLVAGGSVDAIKIVGSVPCAVGMPCTITIGDGVNPLARAVTIYGDPGVSAIVRSVPAPGQNIPSVISINAASNVTVRDLYIQDGPPTEVDYGGDNGGCSCATVSAGSSNVTIQNLKIENSKQFGVYLANTTATVDHLEVNNSQVYGIGNNGTNRVAISNSTFANNWDAAVSLSGNGSSLTNSTLVNNHRKIRFGYGGGQVVAEQGGSNITIQSNTIRDGGINDRTVTVSGIEVAPYKVNGVTITNNRILNNVAWGIVIDIPWPPSVGVVSIHNNQIAGNGLGQIQGGQFTTFYSNCIDTSCVGP